MNKIMVIDDNVDLLEMVTFYLRLKKFDIYPISDWKEIARALNEFQPDLILMDISLNGADGRIICKKLKLSKPTKHIPVILFSGTFDIERTLKPFLPNGFIAKPFENQILLNKINKILFTN